MTFCFFPPAVGQGELPVPSAIRENMSADVTASFISDLRNVPGRTGMVVEQVFSDFQPVPGDSRIS